MLTQTVRENHLLSVVTDADGGDISFSIYAIQLGFLRDFVSL